MRIMMLSHGYPPTLSGVTLVVQKISRALVQKGHEVLVVTGSEHGEPYSGNDQGVQLERVRSLSNPFWSEGPIPWISLENLREIIERFQPDVIHTHENALLSFQLLRLERAPGVTYISSCYYLPPYVTCYLRWGEPLEKAMVATLWRYAISNLNRYDHVIFSTRTQQQEFIEHGLSIPSLAISNGVDTRRYRPLNGQVDSTESRYNLPPRPRVLFVGRLMKDKKIDLLIRAMAHLQSRLDEGQNAPAGTIGPAYGIHLLVVGRGDERETLEALALELGLGDNVHLLGFVPEEDLPGLYRCSDIFAIASDVEVQSIPALQALATGLPIVAVNAAALPELVSPGVNGFMAPPDDPQALGEAIFQALKNPDHLRAMGQASLALVEDHAEEETFHQYESFYRRVSLEARQHS